MGLRVVHQTDRYVFEEQLGSGGFAEVWRARDKQTGEVCAIKVLHARVAGNPRAVQRLMREIEILKLLDHPSVAGARDAGVDAENRPFIAMEYVAGEDLRELMRERSETGREYSMDELRTTVIPIARALEAAHARGIIHRDLKPANVLVGASVMHPVVKVVDFGVAKILETPEDQATTAGRMLGTWCYMSPEQAQARKVDFRTDIFAFGCILFELITLHRPFAQDVNGRPLRMHDSLGEVNGPNAPYEVIKRQLLEPLQPVRKFRPDCSPALEAIVHKSLAPEPDMRFENGAELVRALEAVFAQSPAPARSGSITTPGVPLNASPSATVTEPGAEQTQPPGRRPTETEVKTFDPTAIVPDRTFLTPAPPPKFPRWLFVAAACVAAAGGILIGSLQLQSKAPAEQPRPKIETRAAPAITAKVTPQDPEPSSPLPAENPKPDKKKKDQVKIDPVAPAEPVDPLRAILKRLETSSTDPDLRLKLSSGLREGAKLFQGAQKERILRCAQIAVLDDDLSEVTDCVRAIEAKRRERNR